MVCAKQVLLWTHKVLLHGYFKEAFQIIIVENQMSMKVPIS
jgi:hypothetical protein